MGIAKQQMADRKSRGKTRRFQRGGVATGGVDWGSVDMAQIQETIAKVTKAGGALRFGYTADGGAYALGIYGDGTQPYTEYVRPGEDIEAILADLGTVFDGDETDTEPPTRTAKR